jgi:hypothetical protein
MRRATLGAVPALLLVTVSLWEVCAAGHDASAVPDDDSWHAAEQYVRAQARPGDLIVFAPEWIDPVGRMHLGDLIPIDDAARMDAATYARIWEVSIRGAHAPETSALAVAASESFAGVTVRRFDQAAAHVAADVRALLPAARVEGGSAKLVLAEVGFAPHRCIEVVPAPNHPVRVTFAAMPLGSELVGYVGLADVFTRRDVREPGHLAVELDGKPIAHVDPGVDDGWVRFAAPTQPGSGDLVFVISAAAPNRLVCFAAETRS